MLLDSVRWPSYVQGMHILYKHMDLSKINRKTKAFRQMDKLVYRGDVHQYQVEAMATFQEIFNAKCTLMDYMLYHMMRSFDGKCKTIQYKIAEDINSTDSNLYDKFVRHGLAILR